MPRKLCIVTVLIIFGAFSAAFAQTRHVVRLKKSRQSKKQPLVSNREKFDGWWDYCGSESGCGGEFDCNSLFIFSENPSRSYFSFCGNFSVKCTNIYHHDTLYSYVISAKRLPSRSKVKTSPLPKPQSLFAKCVVTQYKRTPGLTVVHGNINVILAQRGLLFSLNKEINISGNTISIPKNYLRDGMGDESYLTR